MRLTLSVRLFTFPILLSGLLLILFSGFGRPASAQTEYKPGPDSSPQPGVPRGKVTHSSWTSKIFAGTVHDVAVYVPAEYDGSTPACVMVFQDGGGGSIPTVFDNLIYKKEMPVTIGIFITPGVLRGANPNQSERYNRAFEYDSVSDRYARFLMEEILPEVGKTYKLTNDPNGRAIGGFSSGGSCSFTAAWFRPDAFRRVFSCIGSYTSLHDAQSYPNMIRKIEGKPIRIFLQDGVNDQDIYAGSWFQANQEMAAALQFAGYDYKFVPTSGGHSGEQGNALMPDAMRWLWRDYPQPITASTSGRQAVRDTLMPGEEWQLVVGDYRSATGPTADASGVVFFADPVAGRIYKIGTDGLPTTFSTTGSGITSLRIGPDSRLYASIPAKHQIVAFDQAGHESVAARGIAADDFIINHNGEMFAADAKGKKVWYVDTKGKKTVVDSELDRPTNVVLTPDQSMLIVSDPTRTALWSYRIGPNGALTSKEPFYTPLMLVGATASDAGGMATDRQGRLYGASNAGLQIYDQAGRVNGVIAAPANELLTQVAFGGGNLDTLYAVCGNKLYRRKTKVKGVLPFQPAFLPPRPQL